MSLKFSITLLFEMYFKIFILHPATLTYAAFDPVFYFHHANVDRLFANYQENLKRKHNTSWTREATLLVDEKLFHFKSEMQQ